MDDGHFGYVTKLPEKNIRWMNAFVAKFLQIFSTYT
jgi:hypothetical protein